MFLGFFKQHCSDREVLKKTTLKIVVVLFALIVAAITAAAVYKAKSRAEVPVSSEVSTVKAGVIYPKDADKTVLKEAAENAAQLFLDKFNGEKHRYQLEILVKDDNAETAEAAKHLISEENVDVLVTFGPEAGREAAPLAEAKKVLHFSISADESLVNGVSTYVIAPSAASEAEKIAARLVGDNLFDIDAVVENTVTQKTKWESLKEGLEADRFLELNNIFVVKKGETDFQPLIEEIVKNNPDAVVAQMQPETAELFVAQLRKAGVNIPVTGKGDFAALAAQPWAEGMFYAGPAAVAKGFAAAYAAKSGGALSAEAGNVYAALELLTRSLDTAYAENEDDYIQKAAAALRNFSGMETVLGAVNISEKGLIQPPAVLYQIKNGKISKIK